MSLDSSVEAKDLGGAVINYSAVTDVEACEFHAGINGKVAFNFLIK